MSIGLYDIDLWHNSKSSPNLDLMKVYNYLNKQNKKVILMQPNDIEGRFNKIIYFKEDPKTVIPSKLMIYGENKDIFGYGFYNKTYPLKPEIFNVPPAYDLYDIWTHKLKKVDNYEKLKQSSYIRFETKDFSDYKKNSSKIYLSDHNFLYLSNSEDFFQEHRNKSFFFFFPLIAKDEPTVVKFLRYSNLFRQPIHVDFHFSEDFFYENYYEKLFFSYLKREDEKEENYLLRLIKMFLWYKKNQINIFNPFHKKEDFVSYLFSWGFSKAFISYENFYSSNKKALQYMENSISEIRLLLKQNPLYVTKQNLKLKNNL